MGSSGLVAAGRTFISNNLQFSTLKEIGLHEYQDFLNGITQSMQREIGQLVRGDGWGPARKLLNIFIRDAFYDHYLRPAFGLQRFEAKLEIPLDGMVGRRLCDLDPALPKWGRVIGLNPRESSLFQASAGSIADKMNTFRVHLDIIYWRRDMALTSQPVGRK